MSRDLINLCSDFVDDHPFDEDDEGEIILDPQEFFESVPETEIIQFFQSMYNILRNL